ncbi:MAG: hypothetical protein CSA49_00175, partial [Gammaproteobacteria bacterium]
MAERTLTLSGSRISIKERFFYLNSSGERLAVWEHSPSRGAIKDKVILLNAPVGFEQVHTYRSMRRLAEQLAADGFVVIRFDYRGTGDSMGVPEKNTTFEHWVQDIRCVSAYIKAQYQSTEQCWLGLRLGGLLAQLANYDNMAQHMILWEPVLNGRAYIREMQALSMLASHQAHKNEKLIESAGFVMPAQSADYIKSLNLIKKPVNFGKNAGLLIFRDDAELPQKWLDEIAATGHDYDLYLMSDYEAMMDVPHKSSVPYDVHNKILQWLNGTVHKELEMPLPANVDDTVQTVDESGSTIQEQAIFFGEQQTLFGV